MKSGKSVIKLGAALIAVVVLVVALGYLAGLFSSGETVSPGTVAVPPGDFAPNQTARAEEKELPRWYEAVGTVISRATANVAAQVSAPIITVLTEAGDDVTKGQLLVQLDDRELRARKNQAEGGRAAGEAGLREAERALDAAEAQNVQTQASYARTKKFHAQEVATDAELEAAEAAARQAEAGVARAKAAIARAQAEVERAVQMVLEAEVALGYTKVTAPMDGEIARRMADPGDLAWPGRTLVVVQDRGSLQLRAAVREGLWGDVDVGSKVTVVIPAVDATIQSEVEEVEPTADPQSRSFNVKVALPKRTDLYPGMFGRLRISMGTRAAVLVPAAAVVRVGQLAAVRVRTGDRWLLRHIRVGQTVGDAVEVLSGLDGSEELAY